MNTLKLPEGTPVLDMDSSTFATDFANVIGLKLGEKIVISGPQFERTDGRKIAQLVDFGGWEKLHLNSPEMLRALGFGVWEETEKGTHWLFPKEWYDSIPDGYPITYISGEQEVFKHGETDDDYRFGMLAFGFIQEPIHYTNNKKS